MSREKAISDYRELVGRLADEHTLNAAQLATLEIVKEVLELDSEELQKDVAVLEEHRKLSGQLSEARATIEACRKKMADTDEEIEALRSKLNALEKIRTETEEELAAAGESVAELETLEKENPRLFG